MLSSQPATLSAQGMEPTTVLVAEDDPTTRQLLRRFLESKGHRVLVAVDGEQAWTLFVTHQPRLVITDWRMPRLDGLGLCNRIRKRATAHYTFVLILTATTDREAMVQGFAAGADDFMTKPFDRAELTWRIFSGMRVIRLHSALERRIGQLDEARSQLQRANEQMRAGLLAAAKTQRALLPDEAPEVEGIKCAWSYQPSDHLGGDSLNVFKLSDHQLGFFVADVCGHGLSSALLAVTLHRILTPVLGHAGLLRCENQENPTELFTDPGKVLTEVNRRFPMNIENGEYFTAVFGVIDTRLSQLRYAGAGHPNPLLLSEGRPATRLSTEGFPIGFDEDVVYEASVVDLNPGDRIYAFTDGLTEARNREGTMFGLPRLINALQKTQQDSVTDAVDKMIDTRAEWEAGHEDDISMILLEFNGASHTLDEGPAHCHVEVGDQL